MHEAYDIAYAFAIPLYFLMGFSGFYVFGVSSKKLVALLTTYHLPLLAAIAHVTPP